MKIDKSFKNDRQSFLITEQQKQAVQMKKLFKKTKTTV